MFLDVLALTIVALAAIFVSVVFVISLVNTWRDDKEFVLVMAGVFVVTGIFVWAVIHLFAPVGGQ